MVKIANGLQENNRRYPCWNPVLFQPKDGPLMLFYKVGSNPREWWGILITSIDNGKTWSSYPAVIQRANGKVDITYTWKRQRIKHIIVDPEKLTPYSIPKVNS